MRTSQNLVLNRLLLIIFSTLLLSSCASKRDIGDLGQSDVESLYNRAKTSLDRGDYNFAIDYYRALEASYPYGDYTEQAKLDMIYALNKTNQGSAAIDVANNFTTLYPTHPNVDYAYYMKGVANFEKKRSAIDRFITGKNLAVRDPKPYRDSEAAFNELLRRFPESIYADDAKQRLVFLRNAQADREMAIANYYFNNDVYVAALNRAKTVIYQYETSPAVEEALIMMQKSYLAMGMEDLAYSTHEVLVRNFLENNADPLEAESRGLIARIFNRG